MLEHARTLVRQAQAFLGDRQPKKAHALLKEARVLARDDKSLRATACYLQAVALRMMGNRESAAESVRQAFVLDPDLYPRIEELASEARRGGDPHLAEDLLSLLPAPDTEAALVSHRPRRRVGIAVAVLLILAGALGGLWYFGVWPSDEGQTTGEETSRFDIDRIRDNVGLVLVSAEYVGRDGSPLRIPLATGSCFAISSDGFLLTNKHVTQARDTAPDPLVVGPEPIGVHPTCRVLACFGPEERQHFVSRIVYESPYHDLALLKVERTFPTYLKLADRWQPGDEVYTAGFPGKVNELLNALNPSEFWKRTAESIASGDFDFSKASLSPADYGVSVTRGVISAKRRVDDTEWIQHDAVISGGSSGGPLVTQSCRVVGVNTLKHAESEGFNLALGLDQFREEIAPFVQID